MRIGTLLVLLLAAPAVASCATYQQDLARGQRAFEGNEHDRALAIFRLLEPDVRSLSTIEQAHYAYLRGMTDYRIGYKADARYWLAVASSMEHATPQSLPGEWVQRLDESLKDLNDVVYNSGIQSLTNAIASNGKEPRPEPGAASSHGASDSDEPPADPPPEKKPAKPAAPPKLDDW